MIDQESATDAAFGVAIARCSGGVPAETGNRHGRAVAAGAQRPLEYQRPPAASTARAAL